MQSFVQTLRDQLGSHCAELTAGVAMVPAANGIDATAIAAARRRTNLVIAGLSVAPVPILG